MSKRTLPPLSCDPPDRCRGDWLLHLLGSAVTAVVAAFVAAVAWRAIG